ncbi:MAG: hypothetical protein DDT26_01508 [Dehalococcoidia bacterium]|nr:hypothetical protein [Chloroflexota bacterium]
MPDNRLPITIALVEATASAEEEHAGHKSIHYMTAIGNELEAAETARRAHDIARYKDCMKHIIGLACWAYKGAQNG